MVTAGDSPSSENSPFTEVVLLRAPWRRPQREESQSSEPPPSFPDRQGRNVGRGEGFLKDRLKRSNLDGGKSEVREVRLKEGSLFPDRQGREWRSSWAPPLKLFRSRMMDDDVTSA